MKRSLSLRLLLSLILVTVLVVSIVSVVFILLFENYVVSDREATLTACAEDVARLVSEDEAGSYEYHGRTLADYSVFMKTVMNAYVWIVDAEGQFRVADADTASPLHIRELDHAKASLIDEVMTGNTLMTTDFSSFYDEEMLTVLVPVYSTTFDGSAPTVIGAVLVHCTNESLNRTVRFARSFLLVAIAIAVLFSVIAAFRFARRFSAPLKQMNDAARKMAAGDYSIRTDIRFGGEISSLSESLDFLAETLSTTIRELSAEKEKLNDIIENVSDGLCAFDTTLTPTTYNTAYVRMCNEKTMREEGVFDLLLRVTEEKKPSSMIVETSDILRYIATPTFDEKGTVTGCVLIVQDISQSERLERSRKAFVSDVSHEFRTPLTVIKGYVELLSDNAITSEEDVKRTYARIEKETNALERLVGDLLALSRAQSDKVVIDLYTLDVTEILDTVVSNMKLIAAKKNVSLTYDRTPLAPVTGNADRLRQLFIILLDNAVKFTPENGSVTVLTAETADTVRITVRDTGVGIAREDLPYIFERFYKADKSRRRPEEMGTGLGLSIAAAVAARMKGSIEADSEPGKGSAFTVTLKKGENACDL